MKRKEETYLTEKRCENNLNNNLLTDREILSHLNEDNQEELIYYAAKSGAALRDFSEEISSLVREGSGIESVLNELAEKLGEQSKTKSDNCVLTLFGRKVQKKSDDCPQKEIMEIINSLEVRLKIQEAGLLRTNAILKNMKLSIEQTRSELTELINMGNDWLNDYKRGLDRVGTEKTHSYNLSAKSELISRMENKLRDLEISRMVALQSVAQLELMENNNCRIIDRTITALNQTIPLWKNQITILMSSEEIIRRNKAIDLIADILADRVKNASKVVKNTAKSGENESDSISGLTEATLELSDTLNELEYFNRTDRKLKAQLSDIIIKNSR